MQSRPVLLEAIKTKNCKTILRTCHKLKGSSKMLGAIRMQFSLNNWEEATKPAFKNQLTFSAGGATKLFDDVYRSLINLMESCDDLVTPELLVQAKKVLKSK
jgi:HPt (histidine-containing phosphotransfer) domain-containing protein